jgi:hypothetical protein
MKTLLINVLLFLTFVGAYAQVHVRGYYRSNGTYVQPHMRSSPDGNPYNNYSYPGNTNPYTGKVATGNPNTYLDNYYNRNSGSNNNTSSTTLAYDRARSMSYLIKKRMYDYTSYSLYSANYYHIATEDTRNSVYRINDNFGYQVGYATSKNFRSYTIYDNSGVEKGHAKITYRGYYTVYDEKKNKLYTNKRKGRFWRIMGDIGKTVGLIFLIGG